MANRALIQKFLPESVWEIAAKFELPEGFVRGRPDLIVMILESKALATEEKKQHWFDLLPLMTTPQMKKLENLLFEEKKKLAELQEKSPQKKAEPAPALDAEKYQARMENLREKEAASREKSAAEAESLLENW